MPAAIAMVSVMVGAVDEVGVSGMPIHPARPMAPAAENPATRRVPSAPQNERRKKIIVRISTPYITGTSVARSRLADSSKAFDNTVMPVRATSRFG